MEVPAPAQLSKLLCRLRAAPPPPQAPTPACLPGQVLALGDPPTGSGQGPENRREAGGPCSFLQQAATGTFPGSLISSSRARGPRSAYLGSKQIPIGGRGACRVGFPAAPWPLGVGAERLRLPLLGHGQPSANPSFRPEEETDVTASRHPSVLCYWAVNIN